MSAGQSNLSIFTKGLMACGIRHMFLAPPIANP